jgi:DNA-binding IscR family transcriptional regulator
MLAKDPDKYTVGQILRITDGGLLADENNDDEANQYNEKGFRETLWIWRGLEKVIIDYLDGITIQDIIHNYKGLGADEDFI